MKQPRWNPSERSLREVEPRWRPRGVGSPRFQSRYSIPRLISTGWLAVSSVIGPNSCYARLLRLSPASIVNHARACASSRSPTGSCARVHACRFTRAPHAGNAEAYPIYVRVRRSLRVMSRVSVFARAGSRARLVVGHATGPRYISGQLVRFAARR